VLCCAVLCCAVLCCAVLCCAVLQVIDGEELQLPLMDNVQNMTDMQVM
jgi:hypothetical protein